MRRNQSRELKKDTHKKKNTKKTRNARRGTLGARHVCFTPRILRSAKPEFFSLIFFRLSQRSLLKSGNGVMLKRLKHLSQFSDLTSAIHKIR